MTRSQSIDKSSKALKELAKAPKSMTARIRQLLPDIEAALAAGHSLTEILATLGLEETSLDSFKNALYRVRKEQKS